MPELKVFVKYTLVPLFLLGVIANLIILLHTI
jgi:hypothetical protein